jgi:hypothetical protein
MRIDELKTYQPVEVKIYDDSGYAWVPAVVIDLLGKYVTIEMPDGQAIAVAGGRLRPAKNKKKTPQ